jgi:hypothetical protein
MRKKRKILADLNEYPKDIIILKNKITQTANPRLDFTIHLKDKNISFITHTVRF